MNIVIYNPAISSGVVVAILRFISTSIKGNMGSKWKFPMARKSVELRNTVPMIYYPFFTSSLTLFISRHTYPPWCSGEHLLYFTHSWGRHARSLHVGGLFLHAQNNRCSQAPRVRLWFIQLYPIGQKHKAASLLFGILQNSCQCAQHFKSHITNVIRFC